MAKTITFRQVQLSDQDLINRWLDLPHIQEFWDTGQDHRDDIVNFAEGRKTPSNYFDGISTYWLGFIDNAPFAFIVTRYETDENGTPQPYRSHVSKTGNTMGLDFYIGAPEYLGKGLSHLTLIAFMDYILEEIDTNVDTFLIDPATNNARAIHIYQKAGFEILTEFEGGYFEGTKNVLMIKRFKK